MRVEGASNKLRFTEVAVNLSIWLRNECDSNNNKQMGAQNKKTLDAVFGKGQQSNSSEAHLKSTLFPKAARSTQLSQ